MSHDLLVVDVKDNVATALRLLRQGEIVEVEIAGEAETVLPSQAIPFGHKIALVDIEAEQPVIKYGEVIGLAAEKIARGQHVHIHNVVGLKGRRDRA